MEIRRFTPFARPRKNLIGIGDRVSSKYIYKYMNLSTALKCLETNTIRFTIPSNWPDPFEKLYYQADYSNVLRSRNFRRDFVACCLTTTENCEAAWKIYTNDYENDPCIQFKIGIGSFRKYMNNYAKSKELMVYEGKVCYDLCDSQICEIAKKSNILHSKFFNAFDTEKFLNLLLLKRKFFAYEDEIRYFAQEEAFSGARFIDFNIPWCYCLKSVTLPPLSDFKKIKQFKQEVELALDSNLKLCHEKFEDLKVMLPSVEMNPLYENIGLITIE